MMLILPLVMLLALGAFLALLRLGGRALQSSGTEALPEPADGWPAAAMLVPVTGAAPGLAARLESLLSQDYPGYQVVFAVRQADDPAVPIIRALLAAQTQARLVVAGPARHCGQKNYNLLAGLRLVGEAPEMLVFCDSNQMAPPGFLKALIRPIVSGQARVTSGFHHVHPQDNRLGALARAVSVLALYLCKPIRHINQPWGGATAIPRRLFGDLGAARVWATNIVDDVSLAALLVEAGIPTLLAPGATLATSLGGETLKGTVAWLARQWFYLKVCMPLTWAAGGMAPLTVLGLMGWSLAQVGLALLGQAAGLNLGLALAFLGGVAGIALQMRRLHPCPAAPAPWLAACLTALALAGLAHLRTLCSNTLWWRDIGYEAGLGGRVWRVVGRPQDG